MKFKHIYMFKHIIYFSIIFWGGASPPTAPPSPRPSVPGGAGRLCPPPPRPPHTRVAKIGKQIRQIDKTLVKINQINNK